MTYFSFIPTSGICLGVTGVEIKPRKTIKRIQDTVADFYRIPREEMVSPSRKRQFARPRQVAMYLSRTAIMTQGRPVKTLPDIGNRFGGRDHTTVLHALKVVERLKADDPDFAVDVELLREMVTQ